MLGCVGSPCRRCLVEIPTIEAFHPNTKELRYEAFSSNLFSPLYPVLSQDLLIEIVLLSSLVSPQITTNYLIFIPVWVRLKMEYNPESMIHNHFHGIILGYIPSSDKPISTVISPLHYTIFHCIIPVVTCSNAGWLNLV